MAWKAYQVVLRLRSPMHIGQMKIGNIQRTHPYVTSRVLWGALTARLTRRQAGDRPATDSHEYQKVGNQVHQTLAFTYFFPTTHQDGAVDPWPWDDGFPRRFLSTYASTALTYPQQSAAEGTLHEVECIVPHTLDDGSPVYLVGYIFAQEDVPDDWKIALDHLQLGGERTYGWGRVELVKCQEWDLGKPLFGQYTVVQEAGWPPVLKAKKEARLLAHALATDFDSHRAVRGVAGSIEPLVGRETVSDGRWGAQVSPARICYAPGSLVEAGATFRIGPYGIWEAANGKSPPTG